MKTRMLIASGLALALTAGASLAQWPFAGTTDEDGKPTLAPLLKEVTPAVVNIATESQAPGRGANPMFNDPLLERFFGFQLPEQQPQPRTGAGSGVIIDADMGYVLTNHHVIADATTVTVTLADRREIEAEILGSDEGTDIALLRIDADNLTALELGDSDSLEVGDFVLAIGNPFGLGQTVTSGIVSALGRSGINVEGYEDFIQTDASINPGNSGGALIDLNGQLVGINSAIIAPSGGNVGIGFAVPTNMAEQVILQVIEYGEVRRGRLGVTIGDVTPEVAEVLELNVDRGAYIREVTPNSAAEAAGLQPGDVIIELNGDPIDDFLDLRNRIGLIRLGSTVDIVYVRDGERASVAATIGDNPDSLTARANDTSIEKLQGAEFRSLDPRDELYGRAQGVIFTRVDEGSSAYLNGLRPGDVVTAVNRRPVRSAEEFADSIERTDGAFALSIVRNNRSVFLIIE